METALVSQFTRIFPSPASMEAWLDKAWHPQIKEGLTLYACGRGFFVFHFQLLEDRDLIFRNDTFFFGSRGLHLNRWNLSFDPKEGIPMEIPVWVKLPHLPLACWGDDCLQEISNTLGKYIDQDIPKVKQFSCARICVEVDLEKCFPSKILLSHGSWNHVQQLDYNQLPFKCRVFHEYGHFERDCKQVKPLKTQASPLEAKCQV